MSRAFHDCTAECDFKHLIFLFTYRDKNLDKNRVLGCRFFTSFFQPRGGGNWRQVGFFGVSQKKLSAIATAYHPPTGIKMR